MAVDTRLFLWVLCLAAATAGAETPKLMRVPLKFRDPVNLVTDGGTIRLRREYRQAPGQPIVFEAEEATELVHNSLDVRIVHDPEVSGAHCIHYVKQMAYHFEVTTPGRYQVRFRAYFPIKATWNHNEYMNDGSPRNIMDSNRRDPDVWWWTEGAVYDLPKGPNKYVFPSPTAWCGGTRLDKIVLLPVESDLALEELGPAASEFTTPDRGEAISWRIKLQRIRQWRLDYEVTANGGTASVDFSSRKDGGWRPVVAGQLVPVPAPKPRYIYFRFRVAGAPGKPSPWIQGLRLRIEKEPRREAKEGQPR